MSGVNEIRSTFLNYFARQRPRDRAVVAARAAQRPDADVHQCRHGAVQERLHRRREAPLPARHHLAEMRARRRQAQRPRQCRLHRAAPHLLRDARQFLVRRLLQGPRHRTGLESGHQGVRPAEGQADGHRLSSTTTRRSSSGRRSPGFPDYRIIRIAGVRQFLADGRHRPVRPLLGNLLRPRRQDLGRPAGSARKQDGDRFIEIWNLVFMQFEQVDARRARSAAAALDRHRHGAGAHRRHPAGQARQLRHRPVRRPDPRHRRADRRRSDGAAESLAPRHRRSSARVVVPDRRRRAAVERGPRLRAAPDHAPRHAPCAADRRQGAADVPAGPGAGARDGPGLSGTGARRKPDRGNAAAGGDALPQDAGARPVDPRREEQRA